MGFPNISYSLIKNSESVYLNISPQLASLLGWKNAEEAKGKTDYDLPCKAARLAPEFIKQDQLALSMSSDLVTLDINQYKDNLKTLLITRKKISYENQSCLLLEACDISNTTIARYYNGFLKSDSYLDVEHSLKSYTLNHNQTSFSLTKKQELCLYFLVRGASIKKIAANLNLSPRTIEDHLSALKNKFKCITKQQLIEKSIDQGFLFYLPV